MFVKADSRPSLPPPECRAKLDIAKRLYSDYLESQSPDDLTASILDSGTLKDKFTAMKVAAQEHPVTVLPHLTSLSQMLAGKPRIAIAAMQTLEQIYTLHLLPDRPLKSFSDLPVSKARDSHLVLFYFEDQLKHAYATFVRGLEEMAKAQQAFVRDPAIRCIGALLKAKPEAERVLLTILVDKFGDPLKQIAAVATATILDVLREHPRMTQAVITAIKAQQPRFDAEAKKRGLKFLGQLSVGGQETGRELFETVCPQLLEALKHADESNSKVLQSLMRSAEKCAAVCTPEEMAPLMAPLYEFVKTAPFATSLPALMLLFSMHKSSGEVPARYYGLLFDSLVHPDFRATSKQPQLLTLIVDSLTDTAELEVVAGFVHRLLQISLHMSTAFCVATLVVVARLFVEKPELRAMFTSASAEAESEYDFQALGGGAMATFPWMLSLFVRHFDPTVRAIAADLTAGRTVNYEGDPFEDFAPSKQLKRIAAGQADEESAAITEAFAEFDQIPDISEAQIAVPAVPKKKKRTPKKSAN
jgi:ribosome biogenesis protein MAK21